MEPYLREPCEESSHKELLELAYRDAGHGKLEMDLSPERINSLHAHIDIIEDQIHERCKRCTQVYLHAKKAYDSLPKK